MSKARAILIAVVGVVVVGAGVLFARRSDAGGMPSYRMAPVLRGDVELTVTSTGKLNALQSVAVGTQVSGRVTELYADYNDRVTEGQLIARVDPVIQEQQVRNSEANLERVRAALVQAERDYERNLSLYEQKVITEEEFNRIEYNLIVARANLESAHVSLDQARQNLSYTEIYSPIDGIVVERNVEPGQTVAASLSAPQLYLLASDLREMEILATVDESDIGMIRNGLPVRFTVEAYPSDVFEGTVRQVRLSSTVQENVVNYTAVISVQNPDGRLLPGMTATVDFIVERATNTLLVPNAALRLRPTDAMVAAITDPEMLALVAGPPGNGRNGPAGGPPQRTVVGNVGGGSNPGGRPGLPEGAANALIERSEASVVTEEAPASVFVPGGAAPTPITQPSFAILWYMRDGSLEVMSVRTGISDGTVTEVHAPGLEPGDEVIVGINQLPTSGAGGTTNPFQQSGGFRGPGGPGGFGGPPGGFRGR